MTLTPRSPRTCAWLVLAVFAALGTDSVFSAEPVVAVRLASGREFTGAIDIQTGGEALVIRSTHGGMTIRRPIRWQRLVSATLDGAPVEIDDLKRRAGELASEQNIVPSAPVETPAEQAVLPPNMPGITAIAFEARIANWDGDVETDGLILDLQPLDGEGYLAPASGTVEIELFAPQRRVFHHAPLSGGDTLELVERWSRVIRAADFTASGTRLRLPFGAVHPEFDSHWLASHYGLIHVRLAAPGHGTFEASRDGLRIRPWAPNRDQLELNTGRRFVPTEGVGRHN